MHIPTPISSVHHARPVDVRRRTLRIVGALAAASLAAVLFACSIGSVPLTPGELLQAAGALLGFSDVSLNATLLELRLHRALVAFGTGASLALAGVMMQALLRNPLADPYVLGISSGAAVGALGAMLFGALAWVVDAAALGGAVIVSALLFLLAQRDLRGGLPSDSNATSLLLTGVILAAGCGALITLMLSIAPDNRLRNMVFWLIGDLSGAQLRWMPWLVLGLAVLYALRSARGINLMAQHAEGAWTLGIRVSALRQGLFLSGAALAASAVTSAGSIGFVGLIIPHACRFAFGPDHRLLLPAAALAGGGFLVLADTLARTIVAPQQLPVGVITALIGVPVFLMQLHHIRKK
ncbi:MAG TPA: iron ABC transporter permease [Noviherbaspirillum sp.]|nr:iron ABC transporter permease [Noviherbaspirillum sp.]